MVEESSIVGQADRTSSQQSITTAIAHPAAMARTVATSVRFALNRPRSSV